MPGPGPIAIGVDVGGTRVEGLLVDVESGSILDRRLAETPAEDAEATTAVIVSVARDLAAGRNVAALGVGAAGMVDLHGVMRFAPNLAWREFPLAGRVREGTGIPTLVDNDANVAAWGEFRHGAGRGTRHMLLVTVGTGIGGGIVSEGRLLRGAAGFAAEIGHIIVEPGGPLCGCGNRGCWEQVASGRAIDRLGRAAVEAHPTSLLAAMAAEGGSSSLVGAVVTEAARRGDEAAVGVLAEVGRRLGEGMAGLVNVLDPELVVVGGGAVEAGDLLLEPARRAFREAVEAVDHRPPVPILAAGLGNDAGAVGAADLAAREVLER